MAPPSNRGVILDKGDDIGSPAENTTHVQPKGASETQSSENEDHGVPQYADSGVNPVLEEEAQSKGRWFAYVTTKQFWVAMLLGQGERISIPQISYHAGWDRIAANRWEQCSLYALPRRIRSANYSRSKGLASLPSRPSSTMCC